ncbi:hypothetical protein FA95DRAFT_947202 [Auriscalpium vulgare]|uniref:Uncharacterized protein n=1 Tax=Auriscalpium vulgare TaxID=40419 RepID=A0ACB8RZQ2_9AGAM|nr:hypothetical protein FA95DRAFT_947202 [Auriscalpium vulgare]
MTHTIAGDSGVGDHGHAGIDAFINQHICTSLCRQMQLRGPKAPAAQPVSDDDQSDAGEE